MAGNAKKPKKPDTGFYKRMKDRADSLGKLMKEVAIAGGIKQPSLSEWKETNAIPHADVAIKIADFLGVSVNWLITGKESKPALSQDRQKLLAVYDALPDSAKPEALLVLQVLLLHEQKIGRRNPPPELLPDENQIKPLIPETADAGPPDPQ
jgi:transcriptional regulator with XRE-family HTH domain